MGNRLSYATAMEAEYPLLLCQRLAACAVQVAIANEWLLHPEPNITRQAKRAQRYQQLLARLLVPEFREFLHTSILLIFQVIVCCSLHFSGVTIRSSDQITDNVHLTLH